MMYTEENNEGIYIERQIRFPSFSMNYEHFHPWYEFFYLKSGSCTYSVNKTIYPLSPGDVFFVAPGDYHSTQYEGLVHAERLVVYCLPEVIPQEFWNAHEKLLSGLSKSGKIVLPAKAQSVMENLLDRMLEENDIPDEYSFEFLKLYMQTLLLMIQRDGIFVYEQLKQSDSLGTDIDDALRYIALNFAMPLTLAEVAEKVNLSPSYLSRKFKKVTGMTFKEYVNYIRIRQSCQMLLTTDDSITKIAMNCGFNSSNYFKDCFRRLNGMSPRAYRLRSKMPPEDLS